MKRKLNRLPALALALLLLLSLSVTAYAAHPVPDLSRPCSVTVTVRKGETIVKGGSLTIYKVGDVTDTDGNFSFEPSGDFANCGESFADLSSTADLAQRLQSYADTNKLSGLATKTIDDNGSVTFDSLLPGLYLLAQYDAAPGYVKLAPFLVTLPYLEGDTYLYDLTATPKTDLEREPEPAPPPPASNLPQTGQLWWPVPVMSCAGLLLFTAGVALKGRRKADEG